jgi:hypothetical protein
MFLKKVQQALGFCGIAHRDAAMVDAMLEPLPGHSDDEVMHLLRDGGAQEIDRLAPGFISALADRPTLEAARAVAFVHPKVAKQPG